MIRFLILLISFALIYSVNSQCDDLTPSFTIHQDLFCGSGNHTLSFENTSTGANNIVSTYEWYVNGNLIASTHGLETPSDYEINGIGTYTIELIGTDTIPCTSSTSMTVEVVPEPMASFTFTPDNECATTEISFTNTSSNTIPETTYFWDFGDGNTSTSPNPTHAYVEGGTYTVSLTVTNGAGCAHTVSENVTADEVPIFGINPSTGQPGSYVDQPLKCLTAGSTETTHTVNFTHNTTGAVNYLWDFGDGNTSTSPNPTHTYTTYGVFPVTMTAFGANGCFVTSTLYVSFERYVTAEIQLQGEHYSGCAPFSPISLVNNSTNASHFVWDFGDGSIYTSSEMTPPNHTYTEAGNYEIKLSASNSCNTANTTISPIIILDVPQVDFSIIGNTNCAPATLNFQNNTTNTEPPNNYSWDMGNGSQYNWQVNPPTQTYETAGEYTISLTASNACGDSTFSHTIVLDTIPIADFELDPDEGCSPLTVNVTNTSIGNVTQYRWQHQLPTSGNSGYSYGENYGPITYSYSPGNSPITRTITLRASNSCGSSTMTKPVVIHRPTLAQFTNSANTVCFGEDITFTNHSLGEELTYEWDFGNGSVSTEVGPYTINYDTPGTYEVMLVAKGYCGNDTLIRNVVVNPPTEFEIEPLDTLAGCSPLTVSFENNSTGVNLSYQWLVNGTYYSNSKDFGPYTFTETPGNTPVNHTVELIVTSDCGTFSKDTTILVHRPTEAILNIEPLEVCLGESITLTQHSLGEELTYKWDFGNGNTSTNEGPHTIEYDSDGTYNILFVALGYCGNDTINTSVTVHPYPIADFTPDLPDGCEILEMTFTNNSTPSAQHNWDFGTDATPVNSTNFDPGTVNFSGAGIKEIVLTVEENGCVSSTTNQIEVFPLPVLDFELVPNEGCSDLEVQINNLSDDNGVETFFWDFGNDNTLTGYSPNNQTYIAIENDSIYTVRLKVTSGEGCEDSLSKQVIVHPIPVADFDFEESEICQNTHAIFINHSTPGMTYHWDFGDGNSSTAESPTHQYAQEGTYTVALTVSSPFACSETITKDITIYPIADPLFEASTACFGYNTEFTDLSSGNGLSTIESWNWNFGDGSTSTLQNPTHIYSAAGNYTAELSITNNFNCITHYSLPVMVNDIPIADFSIADSCLGDITQFNNLTLGNTVGYEWDFGDGSPFNTNDNPTHHYADIGEYSVQLVAFGGSGCSDTIIKSISINPIPTADFTFISNCIRDTTHFTNTSAGNPDHLIWDFGNGETDQTNNPSPSFVYDNDGVYTVSLTAEYESTKCSHTITQLVDAYPRTTPDFSTTTACFKTETEFTDETTNNPILWKWDFGDGSPIENTQNPTYAYNAPGDYDVTLITENNFGCADTIVKTIVVNELPVADFYFDTVCLNASTQFIDNAEFAVSWEYSFGDGNFSNDQNPIYTFLTDGNHTVQQVVTNHLGCTDTLVQNVIIYPNPTAIFTADVACLSYPTSFENQSVDALHSQWIFDDLSSVSSEFSPTHIYSQDGTFNPVLIVENSFGCTDTISESITVLPQPIADFTNTTVCARDVVEFTNTSIGNPIQNIWNFDDGSGDIQAEDITHVFEFGGTYNVSLIVENNAGCSDTIVKPIEVYTVPNVDFVADTVCYLSVTHFNDLSNDVSPISSWSWDFGDGNTSDDQNPTYIYQSDGSFDVSLTVTNIHGCDSTFTQQTLVSLVPTADFEVISDCFGAPTIFTDLSTNNPGIYSWDFGDGTTTNGEGNQQHTYTTPGIYIVELKVKSSDGVCSDTQSKIVHVPDGAEADFLIPEQVCVSSVFNFYNNSSASIGTIDSYEWIMSDGTVYSTENGTHAFHTPGVHQVTLNISTSDGCQATHTVSIDVLPATEANFEWNNTCSNSPTQFTNTSTGGTTNWFWDFDDGTTSQTQFPTHTFTEEGVYFVTLIVQNLSGCADTIIQKIDIDPTPLVNFTNDIVCYGDMTTFTNQTTISSGQMNSYEWIFGDGEGTSSAIHPQYEFTTYTNNHTVTLIANSDKGCSDTIVKTIDLLPIVDFDIDLGDPIGCAPITIHFNNNSSMQGGSIIEYHWDFDDGYTSFQPDPTHTFLEAGNYNVSLTVQTSNGCEIVKTEGLDLEIFPSPTAAFDVNPPITTVNESSIRITDESIGAVQWEYDLNDGNYSNLPSLTHIFSDVRVYYITQYVQNEYGCTDSTQRAVEILDDFTLYVPNAFTPGDANAKNDYFTWAVSGFESFEISVYNRWGEIVFQTKDPYSFWDGTYNGQRARDGVYIWKVTAMDILGETHHVTGHVTLLK